MYKKYDYFNHIPSTKCVYKDIYVYRERLKSIAVSNINRNMVSKTLQMLQSILKYGIYKYVTIKNESLVMSSCSNM